MSYPLRRCAPSPKGDDTLGAGRPFLGVYGTEARQLFTKLATNKQTGMSEPTEASTYMI